MADRQPVEVASEDLTDLLGRIAVRDLGGAAFNEGAVPAELGDARLERAARARAAEEEQHRQHLVAQVGMRLAQCALSLEVQGHIDDGLDLFLAEVEVADQVAAANICLHGCDSYSTAPRTRASSAMRITTPLKASCQYRDQRVISTSAGTSSMRGSEWS